MSNGKQDKAKILVTSLMAPGYRISNMEVRMDGDSINVFTTLESRLSNIEIEAWSVINTEYGLRTSVYMNRDDCIFSKASRTYFMRLINMAVTSMSHWFTKGI